MKNNNNELVKQKILSENTTFKSVFKATVAFYLAQTLMGVLGLLCIGGTIALGAYVLG